MSYSLVAAVAVGFLTFVAVYPQSSEAQAGLTLTLSIEAVGITISGGGVYDLGGPHGPGQALKVHPSIGQANWVGLPPSITNTGNVDITHIDLTYSGPQGQEAMCDAGSHWAAHASAVGQDQFKMRAWVSSVNSWGTFNTNAVSVTPGTGTGNILHLSSSPLAKDSSIPLLFELTTPNPGVAGGDGCTIGLVVTASAA